MKLHLNRAEGLYMIDTYAADHIVIGGRRYARSLILLPDRLLPDWPVTRYDDLTESDYVALAVHAPELVLVAAHEGRLLPRPRLSAGLVGRGIGVEVMPLGAACRTYNVLVAEGRRVLAAVILPGAAATS